MCHVQVGTKELPVALRDQIQQKQINTLSAALVKEKQKEEKEVVPDIPYHHYELAFKKVSDNEVLLCGDRQCTLTMIIDEILTR